MNAQTIDIEQLQDAAGQASSFLRSIANRDRLLLLCQLSQSELSVTALAALTGIQQPSLSQQLGVLRREGLIAPRKDGKNVYYQISEPKVLVILQQLYDLFCPEEGNPE
ncbi:ArsR/SmtB family transcription factor [Marinobacter changyiensis]|uniref:ArsR/SmtB family transcription factor n=1 Tax=Marinobacter changyiensis TaxID=2604091 RepID=UPI0012658270|nr:helix-turn-helix domain-containing protein [Marinobacter changyiensis]